MAGSLEPHYVKEMRHDINYTNVYHYLAALLARNRLPKLAAIGIL